MQLHLVLLSFLGIVSHVCAAPTTLAHSDIDSHSLIHARGLTYRTKITVEIKSQGKGSTVNAEVPKKIKELVAKAGKKLLNPSTVTADVTVAGQYSGGIEEGEMIDFEVTGGETCAQGCLGWLVKESGRLQGRILGNQRGANGRAVPIVNTWL